jgi:hypothetical protein
MLAAFGGATPTYDMVAAALDAVHALLMVVWVAGIPLLFWHRWPRLSWSCVVYTIVFIVVSQASQWLLGECFLTTWARWFWRRGSGAPPFERHGSWFTVRFSEAVFHLRPTQRAVSITWELLVLVCAIGIFLGYRRVRWRARSAYDLH